MFIYFNHNHATVSLHLQKACSPFLHHFIRGGFIVTVALRWREGLLPAGHRRSRRGERWLFGTCTKGFCGSVEADAG